MKPGAARLEIADGKNRGLYLIIQPSGARSWAYRYRVGDGRTRKATLGSYPSVPLEAARKLASKAAVAIAEGRDPAGEKAAARAAARQPKDHELVENVVGRFLERHAKVKTREATFKESKRILEREIVGPWKGRPLSVIRKSDIHALLDAIVDRGAPIAANRSLQAIRPMFRWAVERDIIPISPCDGVSTPSATVERDRVLEDQELRAIWAATEQMGYPFGSVVQLLILVGQRRDEVAGIVRGEIDLSASLWTLPPERAKNKNAHVVPLSPLAVAILEDLTAIAGTDFLFTTTGRSHISGFAKAKEKLDRLIAEAGCDLEPWTFHDLRRSLATGCARLGVAPQVVEAILNHKGGVIRGVAKIYNRYDHAAEKRAALDLWARHVEAVVSGKPSGNVVEMKAVRA